MDETSRNSSPPLEAGQVLGGKFEVRGVLGEGASGIVYDTLLAGKEDGARVALKVLHPHLLGDSQIRGRFVREAAILRRLQGEHLCPILDFGEVADPRTSASLLYMAILKVEGPSLEWLVAQGDPLPLARTLDISLQICSALHDAHRQGVIHRDLKPANVLLREDGHAFVVDFGMAKIVIGGGAGTTALTSHNMVFGTPEYMAPEQARGDEIDARCDIYAMGIILYELLAGHVPFRGASPLNVLTAHMTEPPPPFDAQTSQAGPALRAVVRFALAKSPDERYASASDLSRALEHARHAPDDVDAVSPRLPIDVTAPVRPFGGSPSVPASAPEAAPRELPPPSRARWIAVWMIAIAVGISVGVWLSLHTP
ncbi:MAG TPA: serine/threonine-protein kinase [Polyangiaceae bacterium]|nr:serine/threonine-protein kinase [Polyangiaceae bacterium]